MDARSPPNARPPTPWRSDSSHYSRAPLFSPSLLDTVSIHCIVHLYAHICANRAQGAPSFVSWGVGTWPTLRGMRTGAGGRASARVLGVCMMVGMGAPL